MTNKQGKLIVVEGGDFSGKSTFIDKIKQAYPMFKYTREPGNKLDTHNSEECEEIRNTLLTQDLSIESEAFLFAKSRELHTKDIIDLINNGYNVICDRYILSSFAYQAYAGGLEYADVLKENKQVLQSLDRHGIEINILLFQLNKENYAIRKALREQSHGLDAIEQKGEEFFSRVNEFFNTDICISYLPEEASINIYRIDANQSIEDVYNQGEQIIKEIINN